MTRLRQAIPVQDAAWAAPSLAQLLARAQESQNMLQAVKALIPQTLHSQIKAGAWGDGQWSLVTTSPASAAKLRQLSPALHDLLLRKGWKVSAIRIKLQGR